MIKGRRAPWRGAHKRQLQYAGCLLLAVCLALTTPHAAAASTDESWASQLNLQWSGRIQSDIRFRPETLDWGAWYAPQNLVAGVTRNQNLFKLRAASEFGQVSALAEVDFLWLGMAQQLRTFADLTERAKIDPYRLKLHAAYVQLHDFLIAGLDVRLGQQRVNWGTGDQFNPTNNLNANDFEDALLFGQQLANSMLRLDYAPEGTWLLSLVVVPIFKPAVLPETAALALSDTNRIPFTQASLRRQLLVQAALAENSLQLFPHVVQVQPTLPPASFDNIQFALRAAWSIAQQDLALSYYYGRSDMPLPYEDTTTPVGGRACNPQEPTSCINGLLQINAALHYPRMQVLGLNVAGEVPLLHWLDKRAAPFGYHLELAFIMPQQSTMRLFSAPGVNLNSVQLNAADFPVGEYPYDLNGALPEIVATQSFFKWNLGVDYTILRRIYLNVQWLHGFVDEFGAGDFIHAGVMPVRGSVSSANCEDPTRCTVELLRPRLGDYLVVGAEMKFLDEALLSRFFIVYDVTPLYYENYNPQTQQRQRHTYSPFSAYAASAILFPEVTYNIGGGLDLSIGALANLGHTYTKFGDPVAGGTEIWTRARYSY